MNHEDALDFKMIFSCAICLEIYDKPIALPCGHTFCRECLREALHINSKCPTCRATIAPHSDLSAENIVITQYLSLKYEKYYQEREMLKSRIIEKSDAFKKWVGPLFKVNYFLYPFQPGYLNIYEPKDLLLHERALCSDRMFVIHDSGQVGQMGILVRIKESLRGMRGRGSLKCVIQAVARCVFVENPILQYDDEEHLFTYMTSVKVIYDLDNNISLEELNQDLKDKVISIRDSVSLLHDQLTHDQRQASEHFYGEFKLSMQQTNCSRLSFFLCSVVQLPKTEKHELSRLQSAKERVLRLYDILTKRKLLVTSDPDASTSGTLAILAQHLFEVGEPPLPPWFSDTYRSVLSAVQPYVGAVLVAGLLLLYAVLHQSPR